MSDDLVVFSDIDFLINSMPIIYIHYFVFIICVHFSFVYSNGCSHCRDTFKVSSPYTYHFSNYAFIEACTYLMRKLNCSIWFCYVYINIDV